MRKIIPSLKDQGILFAEHYIGDKLRDNDPVYLFDKLLNRLDLRPITEAYSQEGGAMYNPREKLSILLFAYQNGITSSIQIARLIRTDLRFMYLAGGNEISAEAMRCFRRKHKAAFRDLFLQTVKLADEVGLIRLDKLFAIDGSKYRANASRSQSRKREAWEKERETLKNHVHDFLDKCDEEDRLEEASDLEMEERERLREIRKKIEALDTKKQAPEPSDSASDDSNHSKDSHESQAKQAKSSPARSSNSQSISSLSEAEQKIQKIEKIDKMLEANPNASAESYLNLTDPESRLMKNGQSIEPCYNVQIVTNQQVIVAMNVVQDENDQDQLQPLIKQAVENLGLKEKKAANPDLSIPLACDAGYNKGENLAYMDRQDIFDPHISMHDRSCEKKEESGYGIMDFQYDEDEDQWLCPQGQALEFQRNAIEDGKQVSYYHGVLEQCVVCPARDLCLRTRQDLKRGYKVFRDDGFAVYRQEMRLKLDTEEGKDLYSKRSGEVEPVFAQSKTCRCFEKFRLKELAGVLAEYCLEAIVHNLGKTMKQFVRRSELMATL